MPIIIPATAGSSNPVLTQRLSEHLKTPGAVTTTTVLGLPTQTIAGTLAAADDADGPWVSATSSTTQNNVAGYPSAANAEVWRDWNPDTTYVIKTDPTAITTLCYWVGTGSTAFAQNAEPASDAAVFRYHTTSDATAFWRTLTDNASGTATVTITTAAIVVNTKYVMRIVQSAADVKFYIDGVLVATHTLLLPTLGVSMGNQARVVNLVGGVGSGRAIKFGRLGYLHGP